MKLIGPFSQILTLGGVSLKGALADSDLQIVERGGVLTLENKILAVADFEKLRKDYPEAEVEYIDGDMVLLPGFIDCHTHLCFAGNRARDYALRTAGKSYLEIAESGGGIWDSVLQTRAAGIAELARSTASRANRHLGEGVTTIEVKSGYGLSVAQELKQLQAIREAQHYTAARLVPTCLAAHIKPRDFEGDTRIYLAHLLHDLLPEVRRQGLSERVDIFIEPSAFPVEHAGPFLKGAQKMGFGLTVHADQFTTGGSELALSQGALSADHLEACAEAEVKAFGLSHTVAVVLPGASLGLGMNYAPARKLLDGGACLAIASDWNPGSAPMGDLLMQAAVMGAAEKLSTAEIFAALTFRAAKALDLEDRGVLSRGMLADMQAYPCADYREILYHQGKLKPAVVWKNAEDITTNHSRL
jgi:imidazolonepropionase